MSHDIETLPIREGPYTAGWFAVCPAILGGCDWTGPDRGVHERGKAVWDGVLHQREMKEAAA